MEQRQGSWQEQILSVPYRELKSKRIPTLQLIRQDYEQLEFNRSILQTPLVIGQRGFQRGLGTHSVSHIRVQSPEPIERFSAWIGVDYNDRTRGFPGSVVFVVSAGGKELYRSRVLRGGQEPQRVEIETGNSTVLDLMVEDAGDGPACDHADWAEAAITLQGGKVMYLDELSAPDFSSRYPFSFVYGDKSSDELLDTWRMERNSKTLDPNRTQITTTWTDPVTGLKVEWQAIRFSDFPALEWVLYFENTGKADTPILRDIQSLDLTLKSPLSPEAPYRLHKTNGSHADPTDFEPSVVVVNSKHTESMGGGGGRSSNKDFPFFKIETGDGSYIVAVGWSGQWHADLQCPNNRQLRATAGLERTHFRLHPGERVRMPRMLVLYWQGDTLESNAQFRQLIYKHYAARRNGKQPMPVLFCNTCFTRGGGWLNECNAENQISLIKAYAPLGLEAIITDAGWFEGGWPNGVGNFTPRKDAYPDGMAPVAGAAKARGMIYGLWFEPERVVAGSWIHKNHPEWLLRSTQDQQNTFLLNLGLPAVQDFLFNTVKGFMELPGFRVYRQDCNIDPLPYWCFSDPPDRQGITEIKYVEGLYAYWDRLGQAYPDSLREECASGGRRIDLETVMRFHIHQKTDYWFDNEVDQASLWALSQYLPNNVFVAHLNRMDDYSFHSTLASSLCLGWIADAPDFDFQKGKKLLDRYQQVRRLLIGAWYPLLPYSRDLKGWIASQYHRPDLNEGLILVFRRPNSPYRTVEVSLHGLDPHATYELAYDSTGTKAHLKGSQLMEKFEITLPEKGQSDLILYKKVTD